MFRALITRVLLFGTFVTPVVETSIYNGCSHGFRFVRLWKLLYEMASVVALDL